MSKLIKKHLILYLNRLLFKEIVIKDMNFPQANLDGWEKRRRKGHLIFVTFNYSLLMYHIRPSTY